MKKLIVFFFFFLIAYSCNNEFILDYSPHGYNEIYLSIQDVSGSDLVKGIGYDWFNSDIIPEEQTIVGGVNDDEFKLTATFPDLHYDQNTFIYNDLLLGIYKSNGYYYLRFNFNTQAITKDGKNLLLSAKMIIFKLKCPYVFGDDMEYEIVTNWKVISKSNNSVSSTFSECYSITFNGIELNDFPWIYQDVDGKPYQLGKAATVIFDK